MQSNSTMSKSVFNIERVSDSGNTFEYKAKVVEGHLVFNGHFPEAPVVPGVCTMNMIKDCIEDALSRSVRYNYVKECKFLSAIIPSEHKVLNINLVLGQESSSEFNVTAEVMASGVKMMKLKATFIE